MQPDATILALVAERTANGVMLCDLQRRITWINAGFTRITGYTSEDVVGLTPKALLHGAATDPTTVARVRASLDAGEPARFQIINYRKDGSPYHNRVEILPLKAADGTVTGFLALQDDITEAILGAAEARRHEQELLRRQRRLDAVQHVARTGAWELDVATGRLWWSQEIYRMFGVDPQTFGATYEAFLAAVHPEDRAWVHTAYTTSVRERTPYDIRHRLLLPDGSVRWVRECCITEYDASGKALGSAGTVQDITEVVVAEQRQSDVHHRLDQQVEALLEARHNEVRREADLSAALTLGRMGAWTFDRDAGLFHFTEEFYRLFRTTTVAEGGPTMTIPAYAERFLPPEVRPLVAEESAKAMASSDPSYERVLDHPVVFADGKPGHIQVLFRRLYAPDGRVIGLSGVNQDITERMRAMEELRAARDQAQIALRTKADFLATMSHEIRTPLNGLLGMLGLLKSYVAPGDPAELLATALDSAQQLHRLLEDILEHARLESGRVACQRQPYDMVVTARSAVDLFRGVARQQRLDLRLMVVNEIPSLVGDAVRVRQIIANLIGNAVKFTQHGGITVSLEADEASVVVRVQDTGIGMTHEQVQRLFRPFEQGDGSYTRSQGGMGLGLAICRELADLMGARLEVDSRPHTGTTFTLVLPRATPERERTSTPVLRILVVEDNPAARLLMRHLLQDLGHAVEMVTHGRDALARLPQGGIDLVLMDLLMPELNGIETARQWRAWEAREGCPRVPMVAVTACVLPSDQAACVDAGMDGFLTKPIHLEQLEACLRRFSPRS